MFSLLQHLCIDEFHKETLFGTYATIYHDQGFFIFGGENKPNGMIDAIGRLDAVTRTWSLVGSLKHARNGHAVVFDGEQFLVIGGLGDFPFNQSTDAVLKTENCVLNGDKLTCTENKSSGLYGYWLYPEVLLVDDNYEDDC